jgi:hypothetical protein
LPIEEYCAMKKEIEQLFKSKTTHSTKKQKTQKR